MICRGGLRYLERVAEGKMEKRPMGATQTSTPAGERLDSWKEISAYLKRDPRTLQRWEKKEGLPVHRHIHESQVSIYAYRGGA